MSLLPGMLQAVKYNFDRKNKDISAFEIGRIHFKDGDHFKEQQMAAILLTGMKHPHYFGQKNEEVDFFEKSANSLLYFSFSFFSSSSLSTSNSTSNSILSVSVFFGSSPVSGRLAVGFFGFFFPPGGLPPNNP